ncbi:1-acyl-sn-glycerol-3-phosphate acyltransferase [Leptospira sp. GIMC2001]|uniref:1-acyl-sn-glycerol-3-phosphate acyltransferase n=1 Tax=Leptospira sp. GIMC2001 TaxID=1513297 RepID=UPI00234B507D|nr:1-acyl-sn-glycerol-3-phosphate acyltransferase [Leptospira sp. GIMC2001]WCL48763.1 1-acyl-sn-glycerol-3-phosphate acyltransferase [Leptospira sp. GIMC2001]
MNIDYNQLNHTVLGSGPMGYLISSLLSKKLDEVSLWIPDAKVVEDLQRSRTVKILKNQSRIPDNVNIVSDLAEYERNSWVFHIAVPSRFLEETVRNLIDLLTPDQDYIFSIFTKGLLSHKSRRLTGVYSFSDFVSKLLLDKKIKNSAVCVVNGPSLLQEMLEEQNTFLNVGCKDTKTAEFIADIYKNSYIQTSTTTEIESMEMAGVLKNPIAIACGIVSALPNCGSNLQGELIQTGFQEMLQFARAMHLSTESFYGRSGLSDLITTAVSRKSRNRNYGRKMVGQLMVGPENLSILEKIEVWVRPEEFIEREVSKWSDTVEGAFALGNILELANEKNIQLPLYQVLFDVLSRKSPPQAIESLLTGAKSDFSIEKMVGVKKKGMDYAAGNDFKNVLENRILKQVQSSPGFMTRIKKQSTSIVATIEKRVQRLSRKKSQDEVTHFSKELHRWVNFQNSNRESEIVKLRELIDFYVNEIADHYKPSVRESLIKVIAPFRFFSGGLKYGSVSPHLGGEIDQIKKLSKKYNILYAPTHRSHLDSVELAYGLNKLQLPIPRYAAGSNLMTTPFWEWMLKSLGAYSVDRERTRNSLYLECLTIYSTVLLESGIPSLVYPEGTRSRTGGIVSIKTGILKTAVDAFRNTGSEIIVVPVALSYETVPEDAQFCGENEKLGMQDFLSRRSNVYMDFCEPIPISEHMGNDDPTITIGYEIQKGWANYHRILPNQLLCKILMENEMAIHLSTLNDLIEEFISHNPGNYLTEDPELIVRQGLKSIRKRKIVQIENDFVQAIRPDLITYYGTMVPANDTSGF